MGFGDQLLATGLAKGAAARGKRIAFGVPGGKTHWDKHSAHIFERNPNIARPGTEHWPNVEWIDYRKGKRWYNTHDVANNRWLWNYTFKASPGEMYFADSEMQAVERYSPGFILCEPNVPEWKSSAINKKWPHSRYQEVVDRLRAEGREVVQGVYGGGVKLAGVRLVKTDSFRSALALMSRASLFIGPEGGLHHGAAAVGVAAVVIFGGFIPPQVTGYPMHTNLARGEACGSLKPCEHCRAVLDSITVDEVVDAALTRLRSRL